MDRIYEVTIEHPHDHTRYYVRASDIGTAATLAVQADAASEAGRAAISDGSSRAPRVVKVTDFCSAEQII